MKYKYISGTWAFLLVKSFPGDIIRTNNHWIFRGNPMIVECAHCHTKFNLPDDKIKPGGVKIRCTRCKNIFDVTPPRKTPPPADSPGAGLDDDLSGFDEGGADFSREGSPDSDSTADIDRDLGGDDFNLDTGDSDLNLDSDLDIGSDDTKGASEDSLEFDMDTDGGADTGGAGDFDFAEKEAEAPASKDEFSLDGDLDGDLGDLDLSFGDSPAPAEKKKDPDTDFDLSFAEEPAPKPQAPPAAPKPQPAARPVIQDDFAGGGDSFLEGKSDLGFGDSIGIDMPADTLGDIEEPAPITRSKKKTKRTNPLTVALLIFLLLAAGGYFAYKSFFSKGFDPEKVLSLFSGNEDPLANLENAEMKTQYYYVMNAQVGKILILEGIIINHSQLGRGRIKVRVTLYDKSGKELSRSESYCGNILDLAELETLSKDEITKLLSVEAGKKFDNAHIKPNESIPYMLAVFSVPEGTDGFVVTIVAAQIVGE